MPRLPSINLGSERASSTADTMVTASLWPATNHVIFSLYDSSYAVTEHIGKKIATPHISADLLKKIWCPVLVSPDAGKCDLECK